MTTWANDAIFYHIYPLGMTGAPDRNDGTSDPVPRLDALLPWADHIRSLGCTALYLGPVFQSRSHGYDTTDYGTVDRRLGTNETLRHLVETYHAQGIRVILDGVFHHVGRDFFAFQDLLALGERSRYRDWFAGVDFTQRSPHGDPFSYEGWNGHYELVKLDLSHSDVREHVFGVVRRWFADFDIDGLRLDAADAIDKTFLRDLAAVCREARPGCWLMGEVVHGDYREWVGPEMLDSATNYECFKGLWSSQNDRNYHEIAYSLQRQFGLGGIYQDMPLYAFADNHDVDRVASLLNDPRQLFPLYATLLTMPGVPSIYVGGEWGMTGQKTNGSDAPLRPALSWPIDVATMPNPDLAPAIARLAAVRHNSVALRHGDYEGLAVGQEHLAFRRSVDTETAIVCVNGSGEPVSLDLPVPLPDGTVVRDALDQNVTATVSDGRVRIDDVPPRWARVLVSHE